jgi:RNA polymerase sigma-70 factor (ECF subfamily)
MLATASRVSRRAVGARVSGLFDEHAGMVLGLCRLLLRDHHEAEDAAQQTFVSAYRSLLRGTEPREPGPWLAAIARNECRARLRKRARAPMALDGDMELELSDSSTADLAEVADRRAELAALATEIAKLPSRQREAIALRDFLGLSYEEVASTLKVSVPVVESLLFRARRRLRDTVRTIPRYAAGLVIVPLAMRAALERDLPGFDAVSIGLGVAGLTGAAAGGIAKLVSLPASVKVAATTVAVVATGSVMGPKLMDTPPRQAAPQAAAVVQGESPEAGAAVESSSSTTAAPARNGQQAPPAASSSSATGGGSTSSAPAAEAPPVEADEVDASIDDVRISADADGAAPLPVPPPPPPTDDADCDDPATPAIESCDDPEQPAPGEGEAVPAAGEPAATTETEPEPVKIAPETPDESGDPAGGQGDK